MKIKNADTLLNFSGGIDSTHALYFYLKNNPDKNLVVHHVILQSARTNQEYTAVQNILAWCKEHKLNNFYYSESVLSLGDIPMTLDVYTFQYFSGLMLRSRKYRSIKYLIIPTPKNEYERLGQARIDRARARAGLIRRSLFCAGEGLREIRKDIELINPLREKYKKEVMEELPDELLEMTWFCRQPTENGEPCRECHTCEQVF